MEITLTLHPVVTWAWIVVGAVLALSLVVGIWSVLRGDELYGWQESALFLFGKLSMLVLFVAIALTIASFIFLGAS